MRLFGYVWLFGDTSEYLLLRILSRTTSPGKSRIFLKKHFRLNISHNQIDTIPANAFSFAPNLQELDLSYNKLQFFNMLNMAAMRWLSIAQNEIAKIIDPRTYPNLETFDASYNPFKCDCDLRPFVDFLKNPRAVSVVGQNPLEHQVVFS